MKYILIIIAILSLGVKCNKPQIKLIRGTIVDNCGEPISGKQIAIFNPTNLEATTDANGKFELIYQSKYDYGNIDLFMDGEPLYLRIEGYRNVDLGKIRTGLHTAEFEIHATFNTPFTANDTLKYFISGNIQPPGIINQQTIGGPLQTGVLETVTKQFNYTPYYFGQPAGIKVIYYKNNDQETRKEAVYAPESCTTTVGIVNLTVD